MGELDKFLLAPEQLDCMARGHDEIKFNVYTADMFSIGMMMLELIFLDDAKFYYNYERF